MVKRLCIAPRWGGSQESEWYPWLRSQELVRNGFGQILGPNVEPLDCPTIDAWVASLTESCGPDLSSTYFVGHSVANQGILHYLASTPEGTQAAGFLAVAGWWTVDEPWDTLRPWMYDAEAPPYDIARIKRACPRIAVLISDNDQFTADWRTTKRQWEDRLGASVRVVPGARHFNVTDAPVVLEALAELAGL